LRGKKKKKRSLDDEINSVEFRQTF